LEINSRIRSVSWLGRLVSVRVCHANIVIERYRKRERERPYDAVAARAAHTTSEGTLTVKEESASVRVS